MSHNPQTDIVTDRIPIGKDHATFCFFNQCTPRDCYLLHKPSREDGFSNNINVMTVGQTVFNLAQPEHVSAKNPSLLLSIMEVGCAV